MARAAITRTLMRNLPALPEGTVKLRIFDSQLSGFIAEQRGEPAIARSWHTQCLTAAQELGDPQTVARALTGLAGAQALGGRPDRAAQLLGAADAAWRPAGASGSPGDDSADARRITAVTQKALGEAAFAAGFQHGRRLRPEQFLAAQD